MKNNDRHQVFWNSVGFLFVLGSVILGTYLAWLINKEPKTGIDDADIYLVYMRNLADDNGFVFQPGGGHVEGFTSLLWTLIGAMVFKITDQVERALLILNVLMVSFALWKLIKFVNFKNQFKYFMSPAAILILGSLVLVPGYFDWTVLSLMETGLWSSLLILGAENLLEWSTSSAKSTLNRWFILYASLLFLCRPESLMVVPLFLGIRVFQIWKESWSKKLILQIVVIPVSVLSGLIIWRLSYFGFPFPNTYYAKVSSDLAYNFQAGLAYLKIYFTDVNPIAILVYLLCSVPLIQVLAKRKVWHQTQYIFTILMLVSLFIPLYVGGDHFMLGRFMQGIFPILLAGSWLILNEMMSLESWRKYGIAFSLVCLAVLFPERTMRASMDEQGHLKNEFFIAQQGRLKSQTMMNFFAQLDELPSQGVLMSGGTAYGYPGETIDLLGLNNVEMAHADKIKNLDVLKNHASFNSEVFFKQMPDLFWLDAEFIPASKVDYFESLPADEFQSQVFQHVNRTEKFKLNYKRVFMEKDPDGLGLVIYASNEFLNELYGTIYSFKILKDAPLEK